VNQLVQVEIAVESADQ